MHNARQAAIFLLVGILVAPAAGAAPYCEAARISDAENLLESSRAYIARSKELQGRLEQSIRIAETLKGRASTLQLDAARVGQTKLTGAALKAAQAQFAANLAKFRAHAAEYEAHSKQLRATLGECDTNKAEFNAQVKKYQLHTERFHIPNIRPPHICPVVVTSQAEADHYANQIRVDRQKAERASQELRAAEKQLNASMKQTQALSDAAVNENKRQEEELKLVQKFARLKEEYDMLSIEHAALGGKATGSLTSTSVKGKIRP